MRDEVLDNAGIIAHQSDIQIDNGASFTPRIKFMAAIFGFAGILSCFSGAGGLIFGLLVIFGSLFILTSRYGTDISLSTNYVREYHKRFFFWKSGKWLPLSAFSDICILKLGRKRTSSDLTMMVSTDIDVSKNEVYLMTHDHRRRFLLKICQSQKEALAFAEEMCEKLNKKLAKFNPQISQQTQQRLRTRK